MKVSILVPLFNTSKQFLKEMLESVFAQTYSNWELCLADASSDDKVGEMVKEIAKGDERVKYKRLESNGGNSANSNAALELATGEIIALLDHDDKLDPDAADGSPLSKPCGPDAVRNSLFQGPAATSAHEGGLRAGFLPLHRVVLRRRPSADPGQEHPASGVGQTD